MSAPVIVMEGVGKRYVLGAHVADGARDAIAGFFARAIGRAARERSAEVWSLRDIDLTVEAGAALALVGPNGAGKSTLLKIVTRITSPTMGTSRTRGRIGSLLEVGTGFHPELTGRENVFLSGAILGMRRRETAARFDEIVAFAGVERFIDTPVKRYSSGMYLRLGFAVAAHLEAEVMVVDEVLAVGDAEFQRRCIDRIRALSADGRTLLFVSHDLPMLEEVCSTALWLDAGTIRDLGPADRVLQAYRAQGGGAAASTFTAPGNPDVELHGVTVLGAAGSPTSVHPLGDPMSLELEFSVRRSLPSLDGSVIVTNRDGVRVLDETWSDASPDGRGAPGRHVARVEIPGILNSGDYRVGIWLGTPWETLVWEETALRFAVEGDGEGRPGRLVRLGSGWDVRRAAHASRQMAPDTDRDPPSPRGR